MTDTHAQPLKADFGIEISFKPETADPARVFRTMSSLIESFQKFDMELVQSIDSKIEPVLILEDIEIGSLRTWLRNAVSSVDDSALESGDWKRIVGNYLLKAKFIVVKKLEGKTEITSRSEIKEIEAELLEAAESTHVRRVPMYQPLPEARLIDTISDISASLHNLQKTDSARLLTSEGNADFNITMAVSPEKLQDLLIKESLAQPSVMILKVKRPDYLGDSMWDFKFGDHPLQAKIADRPWLTDFQNRRVDVRPGDALKTTVMHTVSYGFDAEVVGEHYEVVTVHEVIPLKMTSQLLLEAGNE